MVIIYFILQIASAALGWASARVKGIDPVLMPFAVVLCLIIVVPSGSDSITGAIRKMLTRPDGSLLITWLTIALFIFGRVASELTANAGEDAPEVEDQSWASFKKAKQDYAEQAQYYSSQSQTYTKKKKTFNEYSAPPPPRQSLTEEELHLQTLGLKSGTSFKDIKSAYRKLAKANHPDRMMAGGNSETDIERAETRMQEINDAYAWLEAKAA